MAEINEQNQQTEQTFADVVANVQSGNLIQGMEQKPLLRSFLKYFNLTPANQMRSVNFGETLFRYFAPDKTVPEDPATLLNATRSLFTVGFTDNSFTDEVFVRFVLAKIDESPDLITFDMIADLVESDAYKNFGQNEQDRGNKAKFEKWIYEESILSKIDLCSAPDVVLYKDSITRVLKAVQPSQAGLDQTYLNQIDAKVEEFDLTYAKNVDDKTLGKLKRIAKNTGNDDYLTQLKKVYAVLCDPDEAALISDVIDTSTMGQDGKSRNAMTEGLGIAANKVLSALAQRKAWSEKELNDLYIKFPIEKRAEQFASAKQTKTTPLTADAQVMSEAIGNILSQDDNQSGSIQPNDTERGFVMVDQEPIVKPGKELMVIDQPSKGLVPVESAMAGQPKQSGLNPVLDVAKTFGITLTGAAAISAISAIPGVGQWVGPAAGIGAVVLKGIGSAVSNYRAAKKYGHVSKEQAGKIALASGMAIVKKAAPYVAAMAFGPVMRTVGAGVVFARTLYNDLERRAGIQETEIQKTKPEKLGVKDTLKFYAEKFKNTAVSKLKHLAKAWNSTDWKERRKSLAYAGSKAAAVWLGGAMGREIGTSIGSNVSAINDGDKVGVVLDKDQAWEDLKDTKLTGGLIREAENIHDHFASKSEPAPEFGMTPANNPLAGINISDENMMRLNQIGQVELTKNARLTADVENHRQYVGGVQEDWYTLEEQQAALETLRAAGVEDADGVIRKMGTMHRLKGGKYTVTLKDHLCRGQLTNDDVNNIFDALREVNAEGGLGRTMETDYEAKAPFNTARVSDVNHQSLPFVEDVENYSSAYPVNKDDVVAPVLSQKSPIAKTSAVPVIDKNEIKLPTVPGVKNYASVNSSIVSQLNSQNGVDIDNGLF